MTNLASPFDTLPLATGEVATFLKANGTFHRSFDQAFAASNVALYHFRKPLFGRAKWVRIAYSEIESAKLARAKLPLLFILVLSAVSITAMGAVLLNKPANPWAWLVGALPLYFPYLAYKSAQGRLSLIIRLRNGRYCISAPLDGYKDETLLDNSILRDIHVLIPNAVLGAADA